MRRESQGMNELHKIREQIHEETKDMNIEEKIAYINKEADEVEKKYGLNLRKTLRVR